MDILYYYLISKNSIMNVVIKLFWQMMNQERKARQEIEELKAHIRRMQETERRERRKLAEEDAIRKIKKLEDTISELQKNLAAQKQEEETLLNEMEVREFFCYYLRMFSQSWERSFMICSRVNPPYRGPHLSNSYEGFSL